MSALTHSPAFASTDQYRGHPDGSAARFPFPAHALLPVNPLYAHAKTDQGEGPRFSNDPGHRVSQELLT